MSDVNWKRSGEKWSYLKVTLADQEIPACGCSTFQDEEAWPRQALLQLEDLRLPNWPHISPCTDRASGH